MAKKATQELLPVTVTPIDTDVSVTNDHLVALIVSGVEEKLAAQEDELSKAVKATSAKLKEHGNALTKLLKDAADAKAKEINDNKHGAAFAKFLGLKIDSINIAAEIVEQGGKDTVKFGVSFSFYTADKRSTRISTLNFSETTAVTKDMRKAVGQVMESEKQLAQLNKTLLEVKFEQQHGIQKLERWARGQLAKQALIASGDAGYQQLVENLSQGAPARMQKLLTSS